MRDANWHTNTTDTATMAVKGHPAHFLPQKWGGDSFFLAAICKATVRQYRYPTVAKYNNERAVDTVSGTGQQPYT